MSLNPNLYSDLDYRGLVKQVTSPLLAGKLAKEPFTLYCGFDPTSDSLHIGSLLPLMTLKRFQQAGHRIIAVVGGATGMVGDPSGKSSERQLQDDASLKRNIEGITRVISKFLDLSDPKKAVVMNNHDWFKGFSYLEFLRDVGKHFTVNHMMAKESVRARLEDREHGISYTEFSYMLLQAYDFYHLAEKENCRLQIGGSDQWGNITAGTELIRRMRAARAGLPEDAESESEPDAFGFTMPLVLKSDGTKFGKSETGTVWMSADRTSPYQFYQFLLGTADADVITYLKYFTTFSHEKLDALEAAAKSAPEKREAQQALATELTQMIHGPEALKRAQQATQALFGAEIKELDRATLMDAFQGAPSLKKPRSALSAGIPVIDLLVESGLVASKGAARKEVQGGGVYVNNERVTDPAAVVNESSLIANFALVLRRGKKAYFLIQFE